MHKLLLSLILGFSLAYAGLVNGIALTVNEQPITLYDIDKKMLEKNIGKNQAVSILIDELLYKQLLEKNSITADVFDVNNYIEQLASQNGMDVYSFKSIIRQKYKDYSVFEEETKQAVLRQKLIKNIMRGQVKVASQEDMEIYYENNKSKFASAKSVEVVQYFSQNKASLIKATKSPLLMPQDVQRTTLKLQVKDLNPQLQFLLNNTKIGTFTPIFTANRAYNSLYMVKKEGSSIQDFELVKSKIFADIMQSREKKFLKEYFEKEKLTADIKIVR